MTAETDEFEEFYRSHEPLVRALAARYVRPDEADDVVQEVMLRAGNQLRNGGFTAPPGPWLATVTRNLAVDLYRRGGRVSPASTAALEELAEPGEDAPLTAALRSDVRRRLGQAMARLSTSERALLVRHELDGATVGSLAGALGVSANTLRQRLFRARRNLCRHYEQLGGEYALPVVEGTRDLLSAVRPGSHPALTGAVARLVDAVPPASRRGAAALAALLAVTVSPGPPPGVPAAPPPRDGVVALAPPALEPPLPPRVPDTRAPGTLVRQLAPDLLDAPTIGVERVEAESGDLDTPACGDNPMVPFADPRASGGAGVLHGGTGCTQTFTARAERQVVAIRFRHAGRSGDICSHFTITGAIAGRSETVCVAAGAWVLTPVTSTAGSGAYTVEWVVEDGEDSWVDAHVDHHVLAPAGRAPVVPAACRDGLDNDADGAADDRDPSCMAPYDMAPYDDDELVLGVCDDRVDADGDGAPGYGTDPGCESWGDGSERCTFSTYHVRELQADVIGKSIACWASEPGEADPPPG